MAVDRIDDRAQEEARIRALQQDLETAGILPGRPRTVVQILGPVLMAMAAVLLGGVFGLWGALAGWFLALFNIL